MPTPSLPTLTGLLEARALAENGLEIDEDWINYQWGAIELLFYRTRALLGTGGIPLTISQINDAGGWSSIDWFEVEQGTDADHVRCKAGIAFDINGMLLLEDDVGDDVAAPDDDTVRYFCIEHDYADDVVGTYKAGYVPGSADTQRSDTYNATLEVALPDRDADTKLALAKVWRTAAGQPVQIEDLRADQAWLYVDFTKRAAGVLPSQVTGVSVSTGFEADLMTGVDSAARSAFMGRTNAYLRLEWNDLDPDPLYYEVHYQQLTSGSVPVDEDQNLHRTLGDTPYLMMLGVSGAKARVKVRAVNEYGAGAWSATTDINVGIAATAQLACTGSLTIVSNKDGYSVTAAAVVGAVYYELIYKSGGAPTTWTDGVLLRSDHSIFWVPIESVPSSAPTYYFRFRCVDTSGRISSNELTGNSALTIRDRFLTDDRAKLDAFSAPATGITLDPETLASWGDSGIVHIGQTGARRINADMVRQFALDLTVLNADTPGDVEIARFKATDDISIRGIDIHLVAPTAQTTPALDPLQDWAVAYSIDAALPAGDIVKVGIADLSGGNPLSMNNPYSAQFLHPAGTPNLLISKGTWIYVKLRFTTNTTDVSLHFKGQVGVVYWVE